MSRAEEVHIEEERPEEGMTLFSSFVVGNSDDRGITNLNYSEPDDSLSKNGENGSDLRHRGQQIDEDVRSSVGVAEFECCCCYELMVEPTTLDCGHSLCRHCLARWFLQSKKKQCPQCKQTWTGHPKVNVILRNTIEVLFNTELVERKAELYSNEVVKDKIRQFDQKLAASLNQSGEDQQQGFCRGLAFSVFTVLILYLLWYWGHSDYDLLVNKPIQHWRASDVEHWLGELGTWAQPYAERAREAGIDGTLLMNIDEENIASVLNITTPLHVRAFLSSLSLAKSLGVKPPQNLWDFKALYRGQTLFLLYGMKDFPRVTILFSYMFAYDEVFVPFVQFTCQAEGVSLDEYHVGKFPAPTASQLREFIFKLLLVPYYLIISFTWHWLDDHYWTARLILINCVASTILEIISIWRFLKGNWRLFRGARLGLAVYDDTEQYRAARWRSARSLYSRVTTYIRSWLSIGLFAAVWPLIPVFFTDCIFYIALFYSPLLSIERLYMEFV